MWKSAKFGDDGENQLMAEESDDEEDYMSDAFLSKCVGASEDIRPGVAMSRQAKRAHELEKRKLELKKHQKENKKLSQKERLTEGLNTAIDSSNKGFAMLQKMGYKPGTSLGKEGSGRLEPVKVEVKSDRGGLGLREKLMEIKREKERRYLARIKRKNMEFDPDKFREQKRLQHEAKRLEFDLAKCQRTCYSLDAEKNISKPMEWYFWPPHLLPEEENEDEVEGEDAPTEYGEEDEGYREEEKEITEPWQTEIYVEVVSLYLRQAYHYCIWCGATFESQEDMDSNCPGPGRQDHDEE